MAEPVKYSISIDKILDSLDDLVFELDPSGTIINGWTSDPLRFFFNPDQFLGKSIATLFPGQLSERFFHCISRVLDGQGTQQVEYQSPIDEKYYNARFTLIKEVGNILVLVRDITDLHRMQQQILLSERKFRSLSMHSTDITTIIKPDGTITYQSDSYGWIFGYTESIIGKNIFEFIHPEDHERVIAEIKNGVEKGGVSDFIEFRLKHANGYWINVESKGNNLLNEPGIEGIVVNSRDITDRIEAERRLRENEQMYHNLLKNSMDIITVLNEKGEVVFDSFSILTQFGYNKPLEGSSIFDFVHPDDLEKARNTFHQAMQKEGITEPMEFRFKSADGTWRNVEAIGNNLFRDPSIHGFVINSRDITERKRIQAELDQSMARNKAILESTNDIIFAIDTEYRYIAFNRAHQQVIRLMYGEEIHLGDRAILDRNEQAVNDRIALKELFDRSLAGEQFTHLYEVKHPRAKVSYFEISLNPIRSENREITGVAVFSKDVTELKYSEMELIKARNEALAAASAKSEFLSNMSHEIRTPMNVIIGMTDLLLEKSKDPEVVEYLNSIKYSSDNLLVVINDILDFSKIEAGKVALENINFSIRNKVEEIRKLFSLKAEEKGLYFKTQIDDNVPSFIKGDPYRLNQILFNLIGNSVKFTSHGEIRLHVSLLQSEGKDLRLQFEVSDTGIGIPESKKESIFESFSQAYTDTTRKYGGTGLGLAITRKLVSLMGGKIRLDSKTEPPDNGTIFTIEIPYEAGSAEELIRTARSSENGASDLLKGIRILVAEDNTINQFLISQILSKWDCSITIVNNGAEAVRQLSDGDYDLVLMDLQMPEMNGYEATRSIRDKNTPVHNPDIPIMALTADAFPETRRRVLETGMNDFIAKPFSRDDLFDKILRLVDR